MNDGARPEPPHEQSIPGGVVDPGETPARAAVRELREECAVTPQELSRVAVLRSPTDGRRVHVFVANGYRGTAYAVEPNTRVEWLSPERLLAQARLYRPTVHELMTAGVLGEESVHDTSLTVYHGTNAPPFKQFDPTLRGTATDEGFLGAGYYFSTDPQVGRSSKTLLEAQVHLRNPLVIKFPSWSSDKRKLIDQALDTAEPLRGSALTSELERQGYDGVILDYSPVGYHHQEVVVFSPSQIEIVGPVANAARGHRSAKESSRHTS